MSNIPEGTKDDPRAPWNEADEEFNQVDLRVTFEASKFVTISGFKTEVEDDAYLKKAALNFLSAVLRPKGFLAFEVVEIERLK